MNDGHVGCFGAPVTYGGGIFIRKAGNGAYIHAPGDKPQTWALGGGIQFVAVFGTVGIFYCIFYIFML